MLLMMIILVFFHCSCSSNSSGTCEFCWLVFWCRYWCFLFFFKGGFFFLSRTTWVHPSSPLLGWSPASGLGLSFVVASVVVVFVGGDNVGLVIFCERRTSKNDPTVYSSNIEFSYPQRPPSLLSFHTLIHGVWPKTPSSKAHGKKNIRRVPSHLLTWL